MVQGGRDASSRSRKPFDFDPGRINFVLLTHAHIDHSGLLPKLTSKGFAGPIYTTAATADLLAVMLPDSAHIQEADAQRASRHLPPARAAPDWAASQDQVERPVRYTAACTRELRFSLRRMCCTWSFALAIHQAVAVEGSGYCRPKPGPPRRLRSCLTAAYNLD